MKLIKPINITNIHWSKQLSNQNTTEENYILINIFSQDLLLTNKSND